jgi:uncharacterized integral membrane protein
LNERLSWPLAVVIFFGGLLAGGVLIMLVQSTAVSN